MGRDFKSRGRDQNNQRRGGGSRGGRGGPSRGGRGGRGGFRSGGGGFRGGQKVMVQPY